MVHFERDLFQKVQWHDGSRLSLGDVMLGWILTFDRAMEGSAIFDESAVPSFESFQQTFRGARWEALAREGARVQRPLWASTSTKDPALPDVNYVEALIAPDTVNTLPPETFAAYRDHGRPQVRMTEQTIAEAKQRLSALAGLGFNLHDVTQALESEGVQKFSASFTALLAGVGQKAMALSGAH